jgi:hypothetical protein
MFGYYYGRADCGNGFDESSQNDRKTEADSPEQRSRTLAKYCPFFDADSRSSEPKHMSAQLNIKEKEAPEIDGLQIRVRGGALVFICSCCDLPFASVPKSKFIIQSRHLSASHTNALTPTQLRAIADAMENSLDEAQ